MSDNSDSTQNTKTKYIIIGLIFWALVVIVIIALMQKLSEDNTLSVNSVVIPKTKQWSIQVASFYKDENLRKMQQKLQKANFKTYLVFSLDSKKRVLKGLRIGPFVSKKLAIKAKSSIKDKFKLNGQIIVLE